GKPDIMRDARQAEAPKPGEPTTTYGAEEIRIQQYGDTAIVAFRLTATIEKDRKTVVTSYLNTGTFLKRKGKWQAVSWQATKLPGSEQGARKEVVAAQATLHQAMLTADTTTLESLVDESFIWTQPTGEQVSRQQLIDQLRSGRLKYSKLETNNVTVAVSGETAIVRGVSERQRSSVPDPGESADPGPFTAYFTLTLINRGGFWKAVAMHTSRP